MTCALHADGKQQRNPIQTQACPTVRAVVESNKVAEELVSRIVVPRAGKAPNLPWSPTDYLVHISEAPWVSSSVVRATQLAAR